MSESCNWVDHLRSTTYYERVWQEMEGGLMTVYERMRPRQKERETERWQRSAVSCITEQECTSESAFISLRPLKMRVSLKPASRDQPIPFREKEQCQKTDTHKCTLTHPHTHTHSESHTCALSKRGSRMIRFYRNTCGYIKYIQRSENKSMVLDHKPQKTHFRVTGHLVMNPEKHYFKS